MNNRAWLPWCLAALLAAIMLQACDKNLERAIQRKKDSAYVARAALVIGNGDYKQRPLPNPPNDAKDMAALLQRQGFAVTTAIDADKDALRKAVEAHAASLGPQTVGIFYFAGHGVELDGVNYLLSTGATYGSSDDVRRHALAVDWIMELFEAAGNPLNIVILDACRDNPFAGEVGGRGGLAAMSERSGFHLVFATAPGKVALDGEGRNSPFTAALLRHMARPGLHMVEVINEVRDELKTMTDNRQEPFERLSGPSVKFFPAGGEGLSAIPPRVWTGINPVTLALGLVFIAACLWLLGTLNRNRYALSSLRQHGPRIRPLAAASLLLVLTAIVYPAWYYVAQDDLGNLHLELRGAPPTTHLIPKVYYKGRESLFLTEQFCALLTKTPPQGISVHCESASGTPTRSAGHEEEQSKTFYTILRFDLEYKPLTGSCRVEAGEAEPGTMQRKSTLLEGKFRAGFMPMF